MEIVKSKPKVTRILLKDTEEYTELGSGGEGTIYKYDEKTAIKIFDIFYYFHPDRVPMKLEKVKVLCGIKDPNFAFPKGLLETDVKEAKGYTMDYVRTSDTKDFKGLRLIKDTRRIIDLLIKADAAMQRAHSTSIYLGDIKGENILIDKHDNPKFIDTDNFKYKKYDFDIKDQRVLWLERLYEKKFSDRDVDIYLFTLLALDVLIKRLAIYEKRRDKYYKMLIELSNLSKHQKSLLRAILSDAKDKPYISEILTELDKDKPVITEGALSKLKFTM